MDNKKSGYIDRDKLLSSLTKDDIINIIHTLGSDCKTDSHGNITCNTYLCHGGDSSNKLVYYINDDKPRLHCFTCNSTYDIVELVIRAHRVQNLSMTYYKALRWIASTTGKVDVYGEVIIKKKATDFSWIDRIKRAKEKKYEPIDSKPINENVLEVFANYPWQPWTEEYISYDAMDRFEIGYYGLNNSITIPHRNAQGELIGVRQRYLDEWDIENIGKYTPVQIGGKFLAHRLGNELYGLWVCKEQIIKTHQIILVEAEKSVLQAYSYYREESTVVACCGSNISTAQEHMILDLKVSQVYYAPDRDYSDPHSFEAEAWFNSQVNKLKGLIPYCEVYLIADSGYDLSYKQSPTDCGKEIFEKLMTNKIRITQEEVLKCTKR